MEEAKPWHGDRAGLEDGKKAKGWLSNGEWRRRRRTDKYRESEPFSHGDLRNEERQWVGDADRVANWYMGPKRVEKVIPLESFGLTVIGSDLR